MLTKREKIEIIIAIVFFSLLSLQLAFQVPQTRSILYLLNDFSLTLFAGFVALFSYLNTRTFEMKSIQFKAWTLITWGFVFWFVGKLIWSFYPFALGIPTPFPSFADVSQSIGYALLIPGFFSFITFFWRPFRPKIFLSMVLTIFILNIFLYHLYYSQVLMIGGSINALFLALFYPFSDVILLVLAIWISHMFIFNDLKSGWLFIATGIAVQALANITFSLTNLSGLYYVGSFPDILYLIANSSLALGLLRQKLW